MATRKTSKVMTAAMAKKKDTILAKKAEVKELRATLKDARVVMRESAKKAKADEKVVNNLIKSIDKANAVIAKMQDAIAS